jgi:hypothetical protein
VNIDSLFFETNEKEMTLKEHNYNISLSEAPGNEVQNDPLANPDPDAVGDMDGSGADSTDATTGVDDSADAGADATAGADAGAAATDDGAQGDAGLDPAAGGADATGTDPGEDAEQADTDAGKKYHLFKDYKTVYNSVNSFLEKVSNFKEAAESSDGKKSKMETVDFIEEKLLIMKDSLRDILMDRIKTMDYDKSKTIFVHVKSEINLLLDLFTKVCGSR